MANAKLGTKAVGSIVKLKVNGAAKEFIVVHQGKPSGIYDESCNGTWLLMKDIYENRQWHSSNVNKYETSDINTYLNGPFFNLFDSSIRDAIKQVKIPYRKNGGKGGTDQSGANGLPAKIFLLSGYEVGFSTNDNQYFPVDGAKLDYFEPGTGSPALNKRIAELNGSAASWWSRSQYTNSTNFVWRVFSDGFYSNDYASNSNGIRPALILPPDMEVDSSGNVTLPPPATHKTLVNGTVYEVMGGKCLVNGTVYNILKGRTLIGGTGYDINFEPDVSLTWYFNETIDITSQPDKFWGYSSGIAVSFVSGYYGFTYDHLIRDYDDTYGVRTLIYYRKVTETRELAYRNGWRGEVYRTITFDELPTGDLLTWLQANATPQ